MQQQSAEQIPDGISLRPILAVTVVSSNEELLVPCLDSLLKYRPENCEVRVYVAWNGRARGLAPLSPEMVKRYPGAVMTDSTTSGFPPNQNIMLSQVVADYYLVINDDLIFLPGAVERSLEYMMRPENSRVGLLTVRLLNADGSLQPSTYSFAGLFRTVMSVSGLRSLIPLTPKLFRFANFMGLGRGKSQYWSHRETVEIDSCRGAYMLVRQKALNEVGLWDVKGGEETEWHMRFHRQGWKVVFYHEAEVIHLGSMTVSKDPAVELINLRSFLNIYYKHNPGWRYRFVRCCFLLTYLAKFVIATLRGSSTSRRVTRKGVVMILRWPREVN